MRFDFRFVRKQNHSIKNYFKYEKENKIVVIEFF